MNKRILIVEDDIDINELLLDHLNIKGYDAKSVHDGSDAIKKIKKEKFDLLILDWMLPHYTGLEICKFTRSSTINKNVPIIFLTAKSDEESIIKGLDSGANDFIKKPFNLNELSARVRTYFREEATDIIQFQSLYLNVKSFEVKINDEVIKLTKSEFLLLKKLLKNRSEVFSRGDLIKYIQGDNTIVTDRTVDTHMTGLRKKIYPYSNHIVTVRGIGYKFE